MTIYRFAFALAALLGLSHMAAAQSTSESNAVTRTQPFGDCALTMRTASQTANTVTELLQSSNEETRRKTLLRLLMPEDAVALFHCLPEFSAADSRSTATQNIFSRRTREVGKDTLNRYELAQLLRTLEFSRATGVSSVADSDCIVHDDGGVTCINEDVWICWCDPPDTSGGQCGCAEF